MINIRPMAANDGPDLEDILQIENQSFYKPWGAAQICSILTSDNVFGYVAETNPEDEKYFPPTLITGYMIYKIHLRSIYIVSLAMLKDARREGIGSQLVDKLRYDHFNPHRTTIVTRVGEHNLAAQLFYKSLGFKLDKVFCKSLMDRDTKSEQSFKMTYNYPYGNG